MRLRATTPWRRPRSSKPSPARQAQAQVEQAKAQIAQPQADVTRRKPTSAARSSTSTNMPRWRKTARSASRSSTRRRRITSPIRPRSCRPAPTWRPRAPPSSACKRPSSKRRRTSLRAQANVQAMKAALDNARLNLGWTRVTSSIATRPRRVAQHQHRRRGDQGSDRPHHGVDPRSDLRRVPAQRDRVSPLAHTAAAGTPGGGHPARAPPRGRHGLLPAWAVQCPGPRPTTTGTPASGACSRIPRRCCVPASMPKRAAMSLQTGVRPRCAPCRTCRGVSRWVWSPDNTVEIRSVKVGPGGYPWVITEGLKPRRAVIVAGLQNVRAGAVVKAVPVDAEPAGAEGQPGAASTTRGRPPRLAPPLRVIRRTRTHDIQRGAARMAKFFINRPIVAMVISILMVIVGLVAMVQHPSRSIRTSPRPRSCSRRPTPVPMR